MRGYQIIVGMIGVISAEGVDVVFPIADGCKVVTAVRAAPHTVHRATGHVDSGVAFHVAADIVAAIEVLDTCRRSLSHFDIGHTLDVAHAASAKHRVGDGHTVAVGQDVGRHTFHRVAADIHEIVNQLDHVAEVAAAVDVLDVALLQHDFGHAVHVVEVVAAEDGAHVVLLLAAADMTA